MKLPPDPALLDRVRQERCCWCGCNPPSQAAHIFTKGMGGSARYDLAINVVPLCLCCHASHHAGQRPIVADLLAIAAAREGTTQGRIRDVIYRLRRAVKGTDPLPILARLYDGLRRRRSRHDDVRPGDPGDHGRPPVRERPAEPGDPLRGEQPGPRPLNREPGGEAYAGGRVEL